MYQDWKQWARLAYALMLLAVALWLAEPAQLVQLANWQEENDLWQGMGLLQVVMFTVAAGLIFPKSRRLENDLTNDTLQFVAGLMLSSLAGLISTFP